MGNTGSKWYSRSMGLLGTIILLFLVIHIAHFWIKSRITHDLLPVTYNGIEMDNMFSEMKVVFSNPLVVILYVLGMYIARVSPGTWFQQCLPFHWCV